MKKNLVFIHLESLNQAIFSRRHLFPCINQALKYSASLNNFISTATSSMMAMSDLIYGDDDVMEHNVRLDNTVSIKSATPALFDLLQQEGYITAGVGYPKNIESVDHVWGNKQPFKWFNTPNEMMAQAETVVTQNEPFALYFWNLSSHLCYLDGLKASGANCFDRWQKGYQSMDHTVGLVFQLLLKYQKLDNTVIIAFGDHGDDFWNHGFNGGFAHGIEPYTSLVHTPAFIFNPGVAACEVNHLVSMIDLRKTALQLIGVPERRPAISAGKFALEPARTYCFSRNLFAKQQGLANGSPLKKGYSITSEQFHLVKLGEDYKMYAWQADGANQFDLLSLFKNGKMLDITKTSGVHPHMRNYLSGDAEAVIINNYKTMKIELKQWIKEKQRKICT